MFEDHSDDKPVAQVIEREIALLTTNHDSAIDEVIRRRTAPLQPASPCNAARAPAHRALSAELPVPTLDVMPFLRDLVAADAPVDDPEPRRPPPRDWE